MVKNKKHIKKVMIITFFIIINILIYALLCIILTPKSIEDSGGQLYYSGMGFHSEPENSLDIVVYGNSDVYSGFSPSTLFENYGYTSYASGRANQTVKNTVSLLNKTLKKQTPKLVILEADCFYTVNKGIPDSSNILISPFIYHSRWKEINKNDFTRLPKRTDSIDINKGYIPSLIVKESKYKNNFMGKSSQKNKPIPESNIYEIEKFISICKGNNIHILFVTLPSPVSWNYGKHNAVKELAEKNDIPFIDLNIQNHDYKINMNSDFRDNGNHLNINGSERATLYISKYINKYYGSILEDKRNNPSYSYWNKTVVNFNKIKSSNVNS